MGFVMGNVANPYVNPTKKPYRLGQLIAPIYDHLKSLMMSSWGRLILGFTLYTISQIVIILSWTLHFFWGWVNLVDHLAVSRRLPEPQAWGM